MALEYFEQLYQTSHLMPHGECLMWTPSLLWTHVGSDILSGVAYYFIAALIGTFLVKRRDLPFSWLFFLFALFIVSCGTTHLMAAWTIYYPAYWAEGVIMTVNAVISGLTAIALIPTMPKILALPALQRALEENFILNQKLTAQVSELRVENNKRQQSEALLKESEGRYALTMAAVQDGLWDWDVPSGKAYFSHIYYRMLGYEDQEFVASYQTWRERVHPEDIVGVEEELQQSVAQGVGFAIELRLQTKPGAWVWFITRGNTITRDAVGQAVRMVGTLTDISERKRAEMALREEEIQYRNLANAGKALIWTAGADKLCNYFNEIWLKFTGRPLEQELGNGWAAGVHLNDLERCLQTYLVAFDRREAFETEFRLRHASGDYRWISDLGTPNYNSNGEFIGYIGYCFDITERKREEEERAKLQLHLHQAQKMEAIGVLAGGIAHDFNNILAVIMGYVEMVRDDTAADSRMASDLDKVLTSAHRAKELVKQILSFSRQMEVERQPLKIQPLVKETLKMLRASLPSTISITEDVDPSCGAVLADPTQVHQIVMNLCTNAYHAMETNGGLLAVAMKPLCVDDQTPGEAGQLTPGDYVELLVQDTGSGIGPDVIGKIFDPFFTTKDVGRGTGMGLSITHGIIKSYGGAVWVASQLGHGSTFHVAFPVIEAEAVELREQTEPPLGKGRILLVDDEEMLLEMGVHMLERLGYTVTGASSSPTALDAFLRDPDQFDLVLTDQTMPGLTGTDLARQMLLVKPELPIILCTGYSNLVNEESAKDLGIKAFALKPLTKAALGELIDTILKGNG